MILTLEVISLHATELGAAARKTFDGAGGTIGRDLENTWVLSHPKVSGHHAVITARGPDFYIEDRSRNGVCINSPSNRLPRGRPHALSSGDRLLIDPYEIRVSVTSAEQSVTGDQRRRAERSGAERRRIEDDDPFGIGPLQPVEPMPVQEETSDHTVDPLALLGLLSDPEPKRKTPTAEALEGGSIHDWHYKPPDVVPEPGAERPAGESQAEPVESDVIPVGWNPLDDSQALPRHSVPAPRFARSQPSPQPVPPAAHRQKLPAPVAARVAPVPPVQPEIEAVAIAPTRELIPPQSAGIGTGPVGDRLGTVDLGAVLSGAGLDPALATPELGRQLGEILRGVVAGVMDLLESRVELKDEFGVRRTRFQAAENNPLKFSANVDDALHNLLVKRNPAYLGPVEAFGDAFRDLRNHEVAMLAGMRAAFEAMLAELDPDRLQQEFDRQPYKGLVPAKLRYWDLYRDWINTMTKDADTSYRRLFGEELARAYADHLNRAKAKEGRRDGAALPQKPDDQG